MVYRTASRIVTVPLIVLLIVLVIYANRTVDVLVSYANRTVMVLFPFLIWRV